MLFYQTIGDYYPFSIYSRKKMYVYIRHARYSDFGKDLPPSAEANPIAGTCTMLSSYFAGDNDL